MKIQICKHGLTALTIAITLLISLAFNNGVALAKGDGGGNFKGTGIDKTGNGITLTTTSAGLTLITGTTSNAAANIPVFIVAAVDSTNKNSANYICDGKDDQIEINAAIVALKSKNGIVRLMSGNYYLTNSTLHHSTIQLFN